MMRVSRPYLLLVVVYALLLIGIAVLADFGSVRWLFAASKVIPFGDKCGHLILPGVLSFLLNSALCCRTTRVVGIRLLVGSLIVYLLAFAEEFSQFWLAARNPDIYDLLSDIIGIYVFGVLASQNLKMKTKKLMRAQK